MTKQEFVGLKPISYEDIDILLKTINNVKESKLNPSEVITKIKQVAISIHPKLTVEQESETHYRGAALQNPSRGSGSTINVHVKLGSAIVATFTITTEKSISGQISVGQADYTQEEIEQKIYKGLRALAKQYREDETPNSSSTGFRSF